MSNIDKRNNFFTLDLNNYQELNGKYINEVTNILNKENLVIVSGMKNIGKINFIKEFINKTKINNSYYYFNKDTDIFNKIKSNLDLLKSLNDYVQLYKIPKIIILQNISKINGIKEFISYLYKQKYKVILLGNDIKISGIKEIEIQSNIYIHNENINTSLKYGNLINIKNINDILLKETLLKTTVSDILLHSIFKTFSVKSINLYIFTLTYLSKNNIFLSLRELHKNLDKLNKISLKTTIDYIDFSIQSKIIKKCYKYDIKNNKEIVSKAKYYFTDSGIRNSLVDFKLNKQILIENTIFNILNYNNFTIYSGLNGKFEFTFFIKNTNNSKNNESSIFIHISKHNKKEDIKKEVNKLNKIKLNGRKYLLVEDIKKLGIKKIKYDNVLIIEINDFIINFKQK